MKALMYHYVRPAPDRMPYFRYLHVEDFRAQIDHFARQYELIDRETFFSAIENGQDCGGMVLTFDDGFADHHDHVLPALLERGLWGLFYVPTGMYDSGRLLDVHRVHVLLGRHGGDEILERLNGLVTDDLLQPGSIERYHAETYTRQHDRGPRSRSSGSSTTISLPSTSAVRSTS